MFVQIKKQYEGERKSEYATHGDFCAIFTEHVERLYLLALLLTGDHPAAEQCFGPAFDLCAERSCVFKDSATSWSRRGIIKSAIRIASPAPCVASRPHLIADDSEPNIDSDALLRGVQALSPFALCLCHVRA
jgi:hypothetical protein